MLNIKRLQKSIAVSVVLTSLFVFQGPLVTLFNNGLDSQKADKAEAAVAPYIVNSTAKTVTVDPTGDVTAKINQALSYLINRPDKTTPWTLVFKGGQYNLTRPVYADKLVNTTLYSTPSAPAILKKGTNWSGEYVFYSRYGQNITLQGMKFVGKTAVYNPDNYAPGASPVDYDQGVYFGSTRGTRVVNCGFHDFGNAALRITTYHNDPVTGVNSLNATVENNLFQNVFQVTTTSDGTKSHGGTSGYTFQNNVIRDLRGSIKFASRTAGAKDVKILNNRILNSSMNGYEIVSYDNVEFAGNITSNVKNYAINAYTNDAAARGFNWGNNFYFHDNKFENVFKAIRFSFDTYSVDGYAVRPQNVRVATNTFTNVYDTTSSRPVVNLSSGAITGVATTGNVLTKIASRTYFTIPRGSTSINVSGNTLNGTAYNSYSWN